MRRVSGWARVWVSGSGYPGDQGTTPKVWNRGPPRAQGLLVWSSPAPSQVPGPGVGAHRPAASRGSSANGQQHPWPAEGRQGPGRGSQDRALSCESKAEGQRREHHICEQRAVAPNHVFSVFFLCFFCVFFVFVLCLFCVFFVFFLCFEGVPKSAGIVFFLCFF